MKEQSLRILLALGLLLGLAAGAQAQSLTVAKVPFDFVVSGSKLPAGTYSINRVASQNAPLLALRSSDGKFSALASTSLSGGIASADSKLVFHRYGDEYFLSEVQTPAGVYPLEVTKLEKKLAKASGHDKVLVSVSGGH